MSSTPEATFSRAFNAQLSKFVEDTHIEKFSNRFRRGVPDFYMETVNGTVIWREDKYLKKPWTAFVAPEDICSTVSWVHQRLWLTRAHNHGLPTFVLVGAPRVAAILPYPYCFDPETTSFEPRSDVAKELGTMINENQYGLL